MFATTASRWCARLDNAVLHVDDEESRVRPVLQGGHAHDGRPAHRRAQVNVTCAPVNGMAHWSHTSVAANLRSQAVWVRMTAGPSGASNQRCAHCRAVTSTGNNARPFSVSRYRLSADTSTPLAVKIDSRSAIEPGGAPELALEVGEPADRRRMPRPAVRSPSGCPSRSWSAGTGRPPHRARPPIAAASTRPGSTAATIRSGPIARQRLSRRRPRRTSRQMSTGAKSAPQAAWRIPGSRSAWSGTQRRSHSQIDTSTGHSDRLRGGHQILRPGRIRLVDTPVEQAVAGQ